MTADCPVKRAVSFCISQTSMYLRKMPPNQTVLEQLAHFNERELFSDAAWRSRGLNPSSNELSRDLAAFFHDCGRELEKEAMAGHTPRQMKKTLTAALSQLPSARFDTEEKEFVADIFMELASIINVDIRPNLNRWLYGALLTWLITITRILRRIFRPERVVEVLRQPCTKCNTLLETQILQKQAGFPDAGWWIIRCNTCDELNLNSIGPNVRRMRIGNYKWVESLPKDEYTYEQAMARLEQIRFFRK